MGSSSSSSSLWLWLLVLLLLLLLLLLLVLETFGASVGDPWLLLKLLLDVVAVEVRYALTLSLGEELPN